ncbi:MAG: thiamine-phosphate kinase, partial [Gemmatimonadetes bacterium]|nr:thiamine-phosphate kinase [Gemmatimonadota bacterium]
MVERLAAIGWKGNRAVLLGPGDDAAVLRGGLAVSTDLMVEGVHFRFDWVTPAEAGFRAGAAALSDMAAMGARPEAILVSMALPGRDPGLGEALQRGVRGAGDRVGAVIAGGDVSRTTGPAMLDVVVVGRVRDGGVRRSGAKPGDDLWV